MNIQQKKLVANVITVSFFTIVMIVGFANLKNTINRSESMRAIDLIGKEVLQYRKQNGSLPNESYVNQYIVEIGAVRLRGLQYRAAWIEFGSQPDKTILAYAEKTYKGFVKSGYVVLWLDGRVEWMGKKQFEKILAEQQQKQEIQWLQEEMQKNTLQ